MHHKYVSRMGLVPWLSERAEKNIVAGMKQRVYILQAGKKTQQKIDHFSKQGFNVQSFEGMTECWEQMQEEKPAILALSNSRDIYAQELAQEVRMSEWLSDVSVVYLGE